MRDPATRIDRIAEITEEAIEYARSNLRPWVTKKGRLRPDPEPHWFKIFDAFVHIEKNSPQWVVDAVRDPLMKAMDKRTRKPSYYTRHVIIAWLALHLTRRYKPYKLTRNDATQDIDSASSIIVKALRRLGVTMKEKTIKEIILKHQEMAQLLDRRRD
jgi:hypothetical protein